MKYLKRFNEELETSTYLRAAKKLQKMGHDSRAKDLKDWAAEMGKREEMVKWEKNIEEFSKFGTFKMTIKNEETGEKFNGDFHLDISLDELFIEMQEDGISFFVGLIPTSEDLIKKYMEVCPDYDFGNGFFWGKIFNIRHEVDNDSIKFTKFNLWDYDSDMNGLIEFSDRRSANKFKNLLIQFFTNKDLDYPSGYRDAVDMYEKLENYILGEWGSDYVFKLEDVATYIRTISPNELYKAL